MVMTSKLTLNLRTNLNEYYKDNYVVKLYKRH